MPFLDWPMGRVGDDGEIGKIASPLSDVQYSFTSRARIEGDAVDAVVTFATKDARLGPIAEADAEWERFVGD
jgi:hypothetical protein